MTASSNHLTKELQRNYPGQHRSFLPRVRQPPLSSPILSHEPVYAPAQGAFRPAFLTHRSQTPRCSCLLLASAPATMISIPFLVHEIFALLPVDGDRLQTFLPAVTHWQPSTVTIGKLSLSPGQSSGPCPFSNGA